MKKIAVIAIVSIVSVLGLTTASRAAQQIFASVPFAAETLYAGRIYHAAASLVLVFAESAAPVNAGVHVAYDASTGQMPCVPDMMVSMALLKTTPFEATTNLSQLEWQPRMSISVNPDDVVIVQTADHQYFKLGRAAFKNAGVTFDVQKIQSEAVPEPATIGLFSLGAVAVLALANQKCSQ